MNKKNEKQKNKTLKNSLEQSLKNINNKNPNSKFLNYNKNKPKKMENLSSSNSCVSDNDRENYYKSYQTETLKYLKKNIEFPFSFEDRNKKTTNNVTTSLYSKLTESIMDYKNNLKFKSLKSEINRKNLTINHKNEFNIKPKKFDNSSINKTAIKERRNNHINDKHNNNSSAENNYIRTRSKTNSTEHVTGIIKKKKMPLSLNINEINGYYNDNKRNSFVLYEKINDNEKFEISEYLFNKFDIKKKEKKSFNLNEKLQKFKSLIKKYLLKEKIQFFQKINQTIYIKEIKELKKNLNYHKPIIKQKRNNSIASLNLLSSYFFPTYESDEILSVKNTFNVKKNLDDLQKHKTFSNMELVNENVESFNYKGKNYRENRHRRLYNKKDENLNYKNKDGKGFGYLHFRRKVNNILIPPNKISSFKAIGIDFPEDGDFIIESSINNKNISIENIVNNFQLYGIKKNPYLWTKLPFTLKNLIKKYFYKVYCDIFFSQMKNLCLKDKQKKLLKKFLKNIENKILQKYFHKYYFRTLIFQYIDEKNIEKINNLKLNNEILIEIEKAFFQPLLTESYNDITLRIKSNRQNISIQEKRNKKKFILDYIPKKKKIPFKFPHSIIKIRNHIMKNLLRKERIQNRRIHYIDKKNIRNASMNTTKRYKPIKFIKKVYDQVTGNIYQFDLNQPSEEKLNKHKNKNTLEEIKADEILKEDKAMKMKRVLKLNQLNHYFKYWKFVIKEKKNSKIKQIKKPKFYDILIIMLKCLFTDNINIKEAFMGELYFIKGRYLYKWYLKTIIERKKKEKKKEQK